jgi:hypothetical protein
MLGKPWRRDCCDEVFALASFADRKHVANSVAYLCRTRDIARITPLDDYDVELAAHLREHLRIPGMGETTARYFRDKLAMRARASDARHRRPEFVQVLNHDQIEQFMARVPPPWLIKPRSEASSLGIKKLHTRRRGVGRSMSSETASRLPHRAHDPGRRAARRLDHLGQTRRLRRGAPLPAAALRAHARGWRHLRDPHGAARREVEQKLLAATRR